MYAMDRGDLPNRGETLYLPTETPSNTSGQIRAQGKEGFQCWFPDVNPHTGVVRSQTPVLCRFVRNMSPITLYASQLAHLTAASNYSQIDQLANVTAQSFCSPIDEYLPSYGLRQYDGCWVPVWGPAILLTSTTGGALNVINVGDELVAVTANGTTAADAGHVATIANLTAQDLLATIGTAMSATTTANTLAQLLVWVNRLKG